MIGWVGALLRPQYDHRRHTYLHRAMRAGDGSPSRRASRYSVQRSQRSAKGVHSGYREGDYVLLGQAAVDCLIPLTLIRAGSAAPRYPALKLYFMGTRHPTRWSRVCYAEKAIHSATNRLYGKSSSLGIGCVMRSVKLPG